MGNYRREYDDDFSMGFVDTLLGVMQWGEVVVDYGVGREGPIDYEFWPKKWKLKLTTTDDFWDPGKLVMLADDVLASVFSEATNNDVCEFIAVFGVPRPDNSDPGQPWKATVTMRVRDYLS